VKAGGHRFKALGTVAVRHPGGAAFERLAILDRVWERLYGHRVRLWKLDGVQGGTLYVKTSSPAAAQELRMMAPAMIKELNKHFQRAWIRILKAVP